MYVQTRLLYALGIDNSATYSVQVLKLLAKEVKADVIVFFLPLLSFLGPLSYQLPDPLLDLERLEFEFPLLNGSHFSLYFLQRALSS